MRNCPLLQLGTLLLLIGHPAFGGLVGVELRANRSWDTSATLLIGQTAHVVRFYAVFDGTDSQNVVLGVFDTNLHILDPDALLYQFPPPEGGDTPPDGGLFILLPPLRWDTYVGIGNLDSSNGDTTATLPDFVMGGSFLQGGWFNAYPPNMQGAPDPDNAVFLAQWTILNVPENTDMAAGPALSLTSPHLFGELTVGYGSSGGAVNTRVQIVAETDCNSNGMSDLNDIALGTSLDENQNNIPDECDTCLCGDIDGDGFVGLSDFGLFAGCFGLQEPGILCGGYFFACSDLNGDSRIDLADFSSFALVFGDDATASPPECGN